MWFTILWYNSEGDPIKREILHRDSIRQVWKFIHGRTDRMDAIPEDAVGFWAKPSSFEDTYDPNFDEPHTPGHHAIDIGVPPQEELNLPRIMVEYFNVRR